jgi:hypothetical protein
MPQLLSQSGKGPERDGGPSGDLINIVSGDRESSSGIDVFGAYLIFQLGFLIGIAAAILWFCH